MNAKSAKPSPINDSSRCSQRFGNGKRCTNLASGGEVPGAQAPARGAAVSSSSFAGENDQPDSSFCPGHAKLSANRRAAADLFATLTGGLGEFKSPATINDFLSRLLLLLAQNRISPRRAAVLAYITNQLLRTLSAMEKEAEDNDPKKSAPRIIWDLPRPAHEHRDDPS